MAHAEQKEYCLSVRERFSIYFTSSPIVIDVGSLDINGNNRYLFDTSAYYTGIDLREGKNVDLVGIFHEVVERWVDRVDIVVSTEMLEHDMFWQESLKAMYRILKPGGLMLFTCGGRGRGEHGTQHSDPSSSPFTSNHNIEDWHNYYRNIEPKDVREVLPEEGFSFYELIENDKARDTYFCGIKKQA
jgi:SAM-dependent methyltransferase